MEIPHTLGQAFFLVRQVLYRGWGCACPLSRHWGYLFQNHFPGDGRRVGGEPTVHLGLLFQSFPSQKWPAGHSMSNVEADLVVVDVVAIKWV